MHTAGLLGRSPSAWFKAPSSSPLTCGPQWLFSAHSIFANRSHSSASWVEQSEGHMEEKVGEINAKTTQLLGNQPWVEAQSPLWDAEDSVYFLSISWAPKWRLHTHVLPTASNWTRDHQKKWLQTKAKWPDKAGPLLRILGRGNNSQQHLPSQGKGLGESTLALWGHPTYTAAMET